LTFGFTKHPIYLVHKGIVIKKIVVYCLVLSSFSAYAEGQRLGVGLLLGSHSCVSANYKFEENKSIDFLGSYDFGDNQEYYFHSTYLFRHPKRIDFDTISFGWFGGLGAKVESEDDDFNMGARVSLGFNYDLETQPVEIFTEAAATMNVIQNTDTNLSLALGARYYF
jgi:hypothetical protein